MKGKISFGQFNIPVVKGLVYLKDDKSDTTDYLFVNEPKGKFSMYFEKGMNKFDLSNPESLDRNYNLVEVNKSDKKIKFFCPEKHHNLDSAVWYFYVEMTDSDGQSHSLPGQIRVLCDTLFQGKPKFISVLEKINLSVN